MNNYASLALMRGELTILDLHIHDLEDMHAHLARVLHDYETTVKQLEACKKELRKAKHELKKR